MMHTTTPAAQVPLPIGAVNVDDWEDGRDGPSRLFMGTRRFVKLPSGAVEVAIEGTQFTIENWLSCPVES